MQSKILLDLYFFNGPVAADMQLSYKQAILAPDFPGGAFA